MAKPKTIRDDVIIRETPQQPSVGLYGQGTSDTYTRDHYTVFNKRFLVNDLQTGAIPPDPQPPEAFPSNPGVPGETLFSRIVFPRGGKLLKGMFQLDAFHLGTYTNVIIIYLFDEDCTWQYTLGSVTLNALPSDPDRTTREIRFGQPSEGTGSVESESLGGNVVFKKGWSLGFALLMPITEADDLTPIQINTNLSLEAILTTY